MIANVSSADTKWSSSTLSALEEQMERIIQRDFWTKYFNSDFRIFVPLMFFMFLSLFIVEGFQAIQDRYDLSKRMWLTNDDIEQLSSKSNEKISLGEIYQFQIKNLRYYDKNRFDWKSLLGWKVYAMLIPLVFIIIAFFYLMFRCYPVAIFNWGDMNEWYENISLKRKTIWQVMMIAVFVGLIVNIAASGFVGLLQ
jgi:hypothetical protein